MSGHDLWHATSSDGGRPASHRIARGVRLEAQPDAGPARARRTGPLAPLLLPRKEHTLNYRDAVAAVAAALNDGDRASIGDPQKKVYKVAVRFESFKEAVELARRLARLGVHPSTTVEHDEMFGEPVFATVNIYGKGDQRNLLEAVKSKLHPARQQELESLVLNRGPIPDDILEKIWVSTRSGRRPHQIAEKMNELGVIAGMGGVRWTGQKVKAALAEYERRHGVHEEVA